MPKHGVNATFKILWVFFKQNINHKVFFNFSKKLKSINKTY